MTRCRAQLSYCHYCIVTLYRHCIVIVSQSKLGGHHVYMFRQANRKQSGAEKTSIQRRVDRSESERILRSYQSWVQFFLGQSSVKIGPRRKKVWTSEPLRSGHTGYFLCVLIISFDLMDWIPSPPLILFSLKSTLNPPIPAYLLQTQSPVFLPPSSTSEQCSAINWYIPRSCEVIREAQRLKTLHSVTSFCIEIRWDQVAFSNTAVSLLPQSLCSGTRSIWSRDREILWSEDD